MKWRCWLAAMMCVLCLAAPVLAEVDDRNVVVGRADADASGAWPVGLWVRDGRHSHFIVRAPRSLLGEFPGQHWQSVDAEALMDLERFGAPRLEKHQGFDLCPAGQKWGRIGPSPSFHWPGERTELRHAFCAASSCALPAWRIDLPSSDQLPLRRLLPGIAAHQTDWLVLYVAGADKGFAVSGASALRALEFPIEVPADAGRHFPAIVTAIVEEAAKRERRQSSSLLIATNTIAYQQVVKYARGWSPSDAQIESLGLARHLRHQGLLVRTLLRLQPHDRPVELRVRPAADVAGNLDVLLAINSQPITPERCRNQLRDLSCTSACADGRLDGPYGSGLDLDALPPAERLRACMQRCAQMKAGVFDAAMRGLIDDLAAQQRSVWSDLEKLTGRSAGSWQAR
ncbi:hypothetical protein ACS5PN_14775 [Roseateles sp. NT4]|uniref:hypothetical protein n=1 Tax=Roseateles sp. NT4 TaxID=3453715 RepID=UPI003EEAA405